MVKNIFKYFSPAIKLIGAADRRLRTDNVSVYAAQASYFILFSSVPLIMLFLNIIRYFVPEETVSYILLFTNLLPGTIKELGNNIINELLYLKNISIISITSLLLLWSGSRGVKCIAIAIRSIYKNNENKGYIYNSLISLLYTFILIIIMGISFVILFFGTYLENILIQNYNVPEFFVKGIFSVRSLFSIIIITAVSMFVYRRFSGLKINIKYHFPGALICSLGSLLYTFFFSLYIDNFSGYSYIYGGLAAVLLLMLWLYMCVYILLVGAIVNVNSLKKKRIPH